MGNLVFCPCTHCTPHLDLKVMQRSFINCMIIFLTPTPIPLVVDILTECQLCLMPIKHKFLYFCVT